MRKDETNRYVGTPGGPEEDASGGAMVCAALGRETGGTPRTATSTATGPTAIVGFVAKKLWDSCVSGGQHGELTDFSQSPFMAAQHAFCSGVIAAVAHSLADTNTSISINTPAIGRDPLWATLRMDRTIVAGFREDVKKRGGNGAGWPLPFSNSASLISARSVEAANAYQLEG